MTAEQLPAWIGALPSQRSLTPARSAAGAGDVAAVAYLGVRRSRLVGETGRYTNRSSGQSSARWRCRAGLGAPDMVRGGSNGSVEPTSIAEGAIRVAEQAGQAQGALDQR